jgi:hypothetical protein
MFAPVVVGPSKAELVARLARELLPILIRAHPNHGSEALVRRAFEIANDYFSKRG